MNIEIPPGVQAAARFIAGKYLMTLVDVVYQPEFSAYQFTYHDSDKEYQFRIGYDRANSIDDIAKELLIRGVLEPKPDTMKNDGKLTTRKRGTKKS